MTKQQIKTIVDLLDKAGTLKDVTRTGWVLKGVDEAESVADHTWRMELMVILLTPRSLNREKLMEMCVIHDLGEINIGDIKWETGKNVLSSPKAKHKDELTAIANIFNGHKDAKKYIDLLKEFNEQKTLEAKFLKQIDKLEMALQALEYERRGYPYESLNEFWENAEKYLKGNSLEPIFSYLQGLRKNS